MTAISPAALLTAYFVVTGGLLAVRSGVSTALAVHVVLLGLVAATGWWKRTPAWAREWLPIIAIPVMYAELPAVMGAPALSSMFDRIVVGWEQALFGTQPARALAERLPFAWLSEPLHVAYLSYYGIVVSVPVLVRALRSRSQFHEAVFALLLTFVVCFLCFVAFPVAGPYYTGATMAPDGPIRSATLWLLDTGASRGTAFPSSHVAVTAAQCVLAIRYFGARGALLIPVGVALAAGAVYGGFHYAVDTFAGAALGVVLARVALRMIRGAGQANATAPI